ncbi:MAG: TetR family transcriptional regulator [Angustibacter sp.]
MPAGRPRRIDRPAVLAASLALVDREGLEALTMRRLAAELGVEAMALYRHADNKEALLDGLVHTALGELQVDPADPDWRGQLHRFASDVRALARRHPHVLPLIAARPLSVPLARRPAAALRLTEDLLELFARNGMDDATAVRCHRAVTGWLIGWVLAEQSALIDNPDEDEPPLRLGLHRLPPNEFPRVRVAALALAGESDTEPDLHAGLDALLDALVPPRRRATRSRQAARR